MKSSLNKELEEVDAGQGFGTDQLYDLGHIMPVTKNKESGPGDV